MAGAFFSMQYKKAVPQKEIKFGVSKSWSEQYGKWMST